MSGYDTTACDITLRQFQWECPNQEALQPRKLRVFAPRYEYARMLQGVVGPTRIYIVHSIHDPDRSLVLREVDEGVQFGFGTRRTAIKVRHGHHVEIYWLQKCERCKYLIFPESERCHWPCHGLTVEVLQMSELLNNLQSVLPSGAGREAMLGFCGSHWIPNEARYLPMPDPLVNGRQ